MLLNETGLEKTRCGEGQSPSMKGTLILLLQQAIMSPVHTSHRRAAGDLRTRIQPGLKKSHALVLILCEIAHRKITSLLETRTFEFCMSQSQYRTQIKESKQVFLMG
jgi:hypothetical protein